MDAISLEELSEHFTNKLSWLNNVMAIEQSLHQTDKDARLENKQKMEAVWEEIDELSVILTLMHKTIAEQRLALTKVQHTKISLTNLLESLQQVKTNLPPHLPVIHLSSTANNSEIVPSTPKITNQIRSASTPLQASVKSNMKPSQSGAPIISNSTTQLGKQKELSPCPLLDYLTVQEFEAVPKYMKGRITYQQVNNFIDEMNKAYKAKYKLLKLKKSTLNDFNRKQYETFKLQESKDTIGFYFIVENDLKEFSSIKSIKESNSILTILRHCGRICEVRGSGFIRYAIIETY